MTSLPRSFGIFFPVHLLVIACASVLLLAAFQPLRAQTINVADLGARANSGEDATPAVRAAVEQCRQTHAAKIIFPPGRYDFRPDFGEEKFLFITNNDPGLHRIAFPLTAIEDLEIDGGGAQFVFHGNILPFVLDHSRNVFLHGFSIDWARPFHSEATVLKADPEGLDVQIAADFPYQINHGELVFLDEKKKPLPLAREVLAFDPRKRETAFMAKDQGAGPVFRARETAPGQVRIEEKLVAEPGNVLVFTSGERLYSAITLSDAQATRLAGIDIFHAGGMGIVAQRSRDITLDHIRVTPPNPSRVCSLTADATHFSNCSGQITMEHCLFENQMDDATNIHGIYSRIGRRIGSDGFEAELVHPQQWGFDYLTPGTRVELVHNDTMNTYGEATIKASTRLNDQFTRVVLETELPAETRPGDVVAVAGSYPDVRIAHCDIGRNRARGLLLGSRGKIVIEDNKFHTAGAAILLEGDARYWFEQSGVRDLCIRRNVFESCNYGVWGSAVFQVGAGIDPKQRAASRYNRNILIEDNIFRVFDPRLINAYSVDELTFRRNKIEPSDAYPPQHQADKPFTILDSDRISVE